MKYTWERTISDVDVYGKDIADNIHRLLDGIGYRLVAFRPPEIGDNFVAVNRLDLSEISSSEICMACVDHAMFEARYIVTEKRPSYFGPTTSVVTFKQVYKVDTLEQMYEKFENLKKYKIIDFRPPKRGELSLYTNGVVMVMGGRDDYPFPHFILRNNE